MSTVLTPAAFIDHWSKAEANERANSQSFLIGLTQLLGVPQPSHNHADGYSFEYPVKVPGGTEELTPRFSRAKAADLQEILESLVTLGRARREGEMFGV